MQVENIKQRYTNFLVRVFGCFMIVQVQVCFCLPTNEVTFRKHEATEGQRENPADVFG